jgi:hypothetical protein
MFRPHKLQILLLVYPTKPFPRTFAMVVVVAIVVICCRTLRHSHHCRLRRPSRHCHCCRRCCPLPSSSLSYPVALSPYAPSPLSSSLLSPSLFIVVIFITCRTVAIIIAHRAVAIELVVVVIRHHRRRHCQYPIACLAVAIVLVVV